MNRSAGLSVGFLALVAFFARVGATPESGSRAANQSVQAEKNSRTPAPSSENAEPYEGPWLATQHFFAPDSPPPAFASVHLKNPAEILQCSSEPACAARLRQLFGARDTDKIHCLLATVPDPYHTRLALFTDNAIHGIWKAAGAKAWQFSTQWLPWNDTLDDKESDPAKRAQERQVIREQEKQPGVLVFRQAPHQELNTPETSRAPQVLLVFIVGETPKAGINPVQFQIARAYMQALATAAADTVKIVGPTLSGSFDSLAELIIQEHLPSKTYQVRSGTATSLQDQKAFVERAGPRVIFHGATENTREQRQHFLALLSDLHIPNTHAAILAEGGSAFGRASAIVNEREKGIRVLRFPEDISHLRDSYRQAQDTSKTARSSAPTLDFSLKDATVGEDTIPTYSQLQTPLSQYGVIDEITRILRRDDIRIVEINATNVLDLLFLSGVLRRQCPDTRVLVGSADLLFIQAQQTSPLTGMLFLTSYPPFAESKLWEDWKDRRQVLVFPDTRSEGIYNATVLSLLDKNEPTEPLADYTWQQLHHPAAWLTILDRRGFAPVHTWAGRDPSNWFERAASSVQAHPAALPASRLLNLVSGLFALLSVAVCTWMIVLAWKTDLVVDARFAPPKNEESWRGFFIFAFLITLAAIIIVIGRLYGPDSEWGRLTLLAAAALSPIGVAIYVAWHQCRLAANRQRCLAMAGILAAVMVSVLLWYFSCAGADNRRELFFYRAAELRLGSSPLWPILTPAAAVLVWSSAHATRIYYATCQQPLVMTDAGLIFKNRLVEAHQHFTTSARTALGFFQPYHWRVFLSLLAAALILCGVFRMDVHLASIDGPRFDFLCIGLQFLLIILLLLTCWHIRALSGSLHALTTTLDMLPLSGKFTEACKNCGSSPIWVRRYNLQSPDIAKDAALVLHDMKLLREQLTNPGLVAEWYATYVGQVGRLFDTNPSRRRELGKRHESVWLTSRLLATQMWNEILVPAWSSRPLLSGSPSPKSEKLQDDPETPKDDAGARQAGFRVSGNARNVLDLAETFVALHFSPFLLYAVRQIQNLLWFPCIGFVLLMFSLTSYSFQSPRLIGHLLIILFLVLGWIIGACLAQMERDPVLSRISGSTPGDLNLSFYLKLARYGALPVFGMLAWLFPSISNFLVSWVEPTLDALK